MSTSDTLKALFKTHGFGREEDWKRLSKKKNEAGAVVRIFENRKTAEQIEVIEINGGLSFNIRSLSVTANASFAVALPGKEAEAAFADKLTNSPLTDTDPDRNILADALIKRVLDVEEIEEEDLRKAGKALANRFGFGIGLDMDGIYGEEGDIIVMIAPLQKTHYDQSVYPYVFHLLPKGLGEACEAVFEYSGKLSVMALAQEMIHRGFEVDGDLQGNADQEGKFSRSVYQLQREMRAADTASRHIPINRNPSSP